MSRGKHGTHIDTKQHQVISLSKEDFKSLGHETNDLFIFTKQD